MPKKSVVPASGLVWSIHLSEALGQVEGSGQYPSRYLDSHQATIVLSGWLVVQAGDSHPDGLTLSAPVAVGAVSAGWLPQACLWRGRQESVDDRLQHNKSRLLNGCKCSNFMIIAILLTFVHESKPNPGQPLAESGVTHGHFCRGRPPSSNKDAFGRYDSISITYIGRQS